jgi:transcriptional regulator with XRE-family HTH domain
VKTPAARLDTWLRLQPRTRKEIAAELGYDPSYLTHLTRGDITPGLALAKALELLTADAPGGPIRATDWPTKRRKPRASRARPRSRIHA